jgi:hypothetical protein
LATSILSITLCATALIAGFAYYAIQYRRLMKNHAVANQLNSHF